MSKVIKGFSKFTADMQELIYDLYASGDLERASFPYQGELCQGVIYQNDEHMFLIPVSTITAFKASSSEDDDDDDDDRDEDEAMDVDSDSEVELDEE